MSQLDRSVQVTIAPVNGPLPTEGFGIPLIVAHHSISNDRVLTFTSRQEALDEGMEEGSVLDQMVIVLLSQRNKVPVFKIGRRLKKVRQQIRMFPTNLTVGFEYSFQIIGPNDPELRHDIFYRVAIGDNTESITTALRDQIGDIPNVQSQKTGTNVSFNPQQTGTLLDVIGWIQDDDRGALDLREISNDPGIADDLDDFLNADPDFYAVLIDNHSFDEVEAVAAWVSDKAKMFFGTVYESDILNSNDTTDIISTIASTDNPRVVLTYTENRIRNFLSVARVGERLPTQPGESTWKFKPAAGVVPDVIPDTESDTIEAKGGDMFVNVGPHAMFQEGQTVTGIFIDTMRGLDAFNSDLSASLTTLFENRPRLAYDNTDFDSIRNVIEGALTNKLTTLFDPLIPPVVTIPEPPDVPSVDKDNHVLPGISYSARILGAIHKTTVTGVLTL